MSRASRPESRRAATRWPKAAASKARVRLSMPSASGRLVAPAISASNRDRGRLSTTSWPASSSARSTVDLPAPDRPEMIKIGGFIAPSVPGRPCIAKPWTSRARSARCGADSPNGSNASRGTVCPASTKRSASGRRSAVAARSSASATGAGAVGSGTMPTPRTSSRPARRGGALAMMRPPSGVTTTRSSATSRQPAATSRSARSDLPAPDGPSNSTAWPSRATAVAWIVSTAQAAGSSTRKAAPPPGASSTMIWPPCATTMAPAMDRPRPEWRPKSSPSGRSE